MMLDGKAVATRMRIAFAIKRQGAPKAELDRLVKETDDATRLESAHRENVTPTASGEALAVDSPFVMRPPG